MTVSNAMVSEPPAVEFDATLSAARQALYRFAALALIDPRVGSWPQLTDRQGQDCVRSAAELIRSRDSWEPDSESPVLWSPARNRPPELGLGELPLDRLDAGEVLARIPDSPQELNAEFERAFGLVITSPNPPHETEYIGEKLTFQRSHHLADVAGFYRAFGLEVSPLRPERPDHIVLELEFMAFLIGLERQAAEDSPTPDAERMEVCRDAQAKFLEDHLAWWVPAFARLLAKENPDSLFAAAGRLLAALIPAERALLGVEPCRHNVEPREPERPEDCDNCILQTYL